MRVPVRDKPESLHHSRNFFFSPLKVEAEKKKFMSSVPESVQNLPKSMQKFFQYINNLKFEVKQREWSWLRHFSWDRIQILTILFETWLILWNLYGPKEHIVCLSISHTFFIFIGFSVCFWQKKVFVNYFCTVIWYLVYIQRQLDEAYCLSKWNFAYLRHL